MVEIYKTLNKDNPELLWDLFKTKSTNYNLRNKTLLDLPKAASTTYGTNSLAFKGGLIWNTLPNYIKSSSSLKIFTKQIKLWNGENCTCKICK